LNDLRAWLAQREPLLGQAMAATPTRLIVNQSVVHDLSQLVTDGDEIAFLPPMSGG
jgi:molybdopterin converting factor small subunit